MVVALEWQANGIQCVRTASFCAAKQCLYLHGIILLFFFLFPLSSIFFILQQFLCLKVSCCSIFTNIIRVLWISLSCEQEQTPLISRFIICIISGTLGSICLMSPPRGLFMRLSLAGLITVMVYCTVLLSIKLRNFKES